MRLYNPLISKAWHGHAPSAIVGGRVISYLHPRLFVGWWGVIYVFYACHTDSWKRTFKKLRVSEQEMWVTPTTNWVDILNR